ncbi:MAG TPA: HAD family hydrolase [Verrucomicrobiota bacterium]|nr:hypothetical protein [Verrucomicrobiales bacterium]HRI13042.1 HAD family hydrolase [Verrucomicrobiota bacterium]
MNVKAIIFDIYSTILEVGPAPVDAESRWQQIFKNAVHKPPLITRAEFSAAASRVIAQRHHWARSRGIAWPEIQWPSVVIELVPELAGVNEATRNEFIYQQIQLGRTLQLTSEAAAVLRWLRRKNLLLGIASNSQAYTLRELEELLAEHGLSLDLFAVDLRFWSFQNGFSKPDPHVFQGLAARLEARGLRPSEVLMVGDRLDNDINPARAFGWQTWHLTAQPESDPGGGWSELMVHLQTD